MPNIFCQQCGKHTDHTQLVDQFADKCLVCGHVGIAIDRVKTEANKFYTPQGSEATVVRDNADQVIFSIDKGEEAGYYVYDKHSGFGGVQKRSVEC